MSEVIAVLIFVIGVVVGWKLRAVFVFWRNIRKLRKLGF